MTEMDRAGPMGRVGRATPVDTKPKAMQPDLIQNQAGLILHNSAQPNLTHLVIIQTTPNKL